MSKLAVISVIERTRFETNAIVFLVSLMEPGFTRFNPLAGKVFTSVGSSTSNTRKSVSNAGNQIPNIRDSFSSARHSVSNTSNPVSNTRNSVTSVRNSVSNTSDLVTDTSNSVPESGHMVSSVVPREKSEPGEPGQGCVGSATGIPRLTLNRRLRRRS